MACPVDASFRSLESAGPKEKIGASLAERFTHLFIHVHSPATLKIPMVSKLNMNLVSTNLFAQ